MIDPHVVEVCYIEGVIQAVAISVDNAIRLYFTSNYGDHGISFRVPNSDCKHVPASFQQTKNRNLSGRAATALSFPYTTEIAFINFDLTGKLSGFLAKLFGDDNAQSMIKLCRGDLVYTNQQARCSSRCPGHEVLKQLICLNMCEF